MVGDSKLSPKLTSKEVFGNECMFSIYIECKRTLVYRRVDEFRAVCVAVKWPPCGVRVCVDICCLEF